ncbi:uncharacterized protein LOC131628812 [Vicia villosa]|uniref:uncharacterized protein LOC131628812 n=1 Tax=Vicia villosa TaxID=3911 RepID=UPI00273BD7E9|nr:uncharacterized protein LOC131628812 [Vicia villosa]
MIKLNSDGACKANNAAGCGGLLRDHKGQWRGEGLKLARKLGVRHLEINTDSLLVVKAIEDGKVGMVDCVAMPRRIMELMGEFEVVIISHVSRNANACADCLAKHGCRGEVLHHYTDPPPFLADLLEADSCGIIFSSVVIE